LFLYLGGETVIRIRDIIAILNVENNRTWHDNLPPKFQNRIIGQEPPLAREEVKSLVITPQGVYLSSISSGTLKKRAELFTRHHE